jgi:hypothetical protein
MSTTHDSRIGLDLAPDYPPTITQSIPSKLRFGISPRRGSMERNLTFAAVFRLGAGIDKMINRYYYVYNMHNSEYTTDKVSVF